MKISKKQINKAGEIIRNGTVNEKEQTIELLNLWRVISERSLTAG